METKDTYSLATMNLAVEVIVAKELRLTRPVKR
jgi:hypothetical protein